MHFWSNLQTSSQLKGELDKQELNHHQQVMLQKSQKKSPPCAMLFIPTTKNKLFFNDNRLVSSSFISSPNYQLPTHTCHGIISDSFPYKGRVANGCCRCLFASLVVPARQGVLVELVVEESIWKKKCIISQSKRYKCPTNSSNQHLDYGYFGDMVHTPNLFESPFLTISFTDNFS